MSSGELYGLKQDNGVIQQPLEKKRGEKNNKQIKENDDALCNRREINQIRECRAKRSQ